MKIVNLSEFLALPGQTLFSKYESCRFGALAISLGPLRSIRNDFHVDYLVGILIEADDSSESWDLLRTSEKDGISLKMDFGCTGRDGLYKDDQLFAVYERADVIQLIERLQRVVDSTAPQTEAEALLVATHRHYKGGLYRVLNDQVKHSESEQVLVTYEHVWPHTPGQQWARPRDMFYGKLADGRLRFEPIPK